MDWRRLRHRDVRTTEAGEAVELFCKDIRDALRRSWISPEERTAQAKAVALQRAEDERKQQEAEERRQEEEARIRVAAARERERADQERRQRETDAERQRAEERRLSDEAQANYRAAEEQHRAEKEERRRQQRSEARPLWPPSRSALAAGSVICLLLIGAIGVWLAAPPAPIAIKQTTPSTVMPSAPVSPAPPPQVTPAPAPVIPAPATPTPAPVEPAPAFPFNFNPPAPVTPAPATPTPAPVEPAPVFHFNFNAPLSPDRERALKPGDAFQECTNCPVMKVVPAGRFIMGSPASEPKREIDEGPQHKVTIAHRFAVGQYELTFDEWDACVADGGCDGYLPGDAGWGRGRQPVINVSRNDAQAYVAWLAKKTGQPYRLLSEAEYEYATRAGTTTAFPWGNLVGRGNANCDGCGSQWDGKRTAPVGSFPANAFGLYDMNGNIYEWVEDCYHHSYKGAPGDGSAWAGGGCVLAVPADEPFRVHGHVLRGGSWFNPPSVARSADRYGDGDGPTARSNASGFRVARPLLAP